MALATAAASSSLLEAHTDKMLVSRKITGQVRALDKELAGHGQNLFYASKEQ